VRILFMGTPEFAVPALQVLLNGGYDVVGVVTQPDRPKGRKRVLTPTPVKEEALKHDLLVLQPEKLRQPESVEAIRQLAPDLIVTAAYGQILPKSILDMPKHGCINIHASLLPKYRGGAPIHYAVMHGEKVTGVTIMYMEVGLDTGDMISKVEVPIGEQDTTGSMFSKLSVAGAELLEKTLPDLLAGRIQAVPQDDSEAIYSPNISREDEKIDWSKSAREIHNQVRGLNPFPGAFTIWNGENLKVWRSEVSSVNVADGSAAPGTVVGLTDNGIVVQTGDGQLMLSEIQPAGKKAMEAKQFLLGSSMERGTVLGE
jgi:methionyl-tRNA formyltransferase